MWFDICAGDFHELCNQDVDSESEDQWFTPDYAEERSVERCPTRLVLSLITPCERLRPSGLRSILQRCPRNGRVSTAEHIEGYSFGASRVVHTPSKCRSVGDGKKLCSQPSGQHWRHPSARYVAHLAPVGHARVHMVPTGADDGC